MSTGDAVAGELLVLLPAFNEAARLPAVLAELERTLDEPYRAVVIDDGSRDATADVARAAGATVLELAFNLGYGAALQTGYKYARECRAAVIVQMDADGQHDARDIPRLLDPLRSDTADLVIGSRFVEKTSYEMGRIRTIGRLLFQRLAGLSGLSVTDPTSGFQAMNARVLELYTGAFFPSDYPDVDVLLTAHRAGLRIAERSVQMRAETRKSTLHGGLRSLYYLYRLALSLWAGSGAPRQIGERT
jgi:glycosyltransferase involved in cell wall biosynthesis